MDFFNGLLQTEVIMSKAKKLAFTLGAAGVSLLPIKAVAQDVENIVKDYKRQTQTELREFKSALDSAFVQFKAVQDKKVADLRDELERAIRKKKFAEELAKPWKEYELQSDDVMISKQRKAQKAR